VSLSYGSDRASVDIQPFGLQVLQETGRARVLKFHYAEREAAYKLFFLSLCLARPFCTSGSPADLRAISPGFDSRFLICLTARMYCNLNCDINKVLELAYRQRPPMHQATNPRDLIYALLGLVSGPTGIEVRYDLSVEYAYLSATRLLLSQGFTEILLSFKPKPSRVRPFLRGLMIGRPEAYLPLANMRLADILNRHCPLYSSRV
jgi:hypothetical protein